MNALDEYIKVKIKSILMSLNYGDILSIDDKKTIYLGVDKEGNILYKALEDIAPDIISKDKMEKKINKQIKHGKI